MTIRAVVWDIDDTLWDYTGSDRAGALRHLAAEGLLDRFPSPEAALLRWRSVMEEQYARFEAGELTFEEQRRERARGFLGQPLTDAEADAWFDRYLAHRAGDHVPFPDVLPALDALTPGYRHGLLSNSGLRNQERKLLALGIRDRFEVLICSDEAGHAKPAPEAFWAVCAAMRLPPHAVAYVGDRPDIDAAGATAAGLHGIWLDRSPAPAPAGGPPHRITGLAALPALLAELGRRPAA
ncbi:HAD family hydrolase [Streptomyces sp. 8K308]|uniref:HAD family hydrolase n=1 Tax=Streptomyces sp. 8K308 TaxID=2530388 RepID=UPI00104C1D56|nr:HAD family hydrolase [Streptomyces sp. 8K308]TDC06467.1 HAD family hydrolase [Streptomyces sp. 8K308]